MAHFGIVFFGKPSLAPFLTALGMAVGTCLAAAAQYTWDGGGGDNNWGTANNWNLNVAPSPGASGASGNDLIFASASPRASPNMETDYKVRSITFSASGGTFTITAAAGKKMELEAGSITNLNAGTHSLGMGTIDLIGNQTWDAGSGGLTFGGTSLGLKSGSILTIAGGGGITIANVVYDSGSIVMSGSGTLTLQNNNTFTGSLTVNSGTVVFGNDGANGTGALILNGGTVQAGGGARTLTESVTVGGDFAVGGTNNFTLSGDMNLGSSVRTVTVNNTGNTTFSGVLSGTGGLTKGGAETLTLSGNNTFGGVLRVNSGTLSIGTINNASTAGVLGNSANAVVLGGSGTTGILKYTGATASSSKAFTLATGGTGGFQVDNSGTTLTLSGSIGGSGNLAKTGSGTLHLTAANNYGGATAIQAGAIQVSGGSDRLPTGTTVTLGSGSTSGKLILGNDQTLAGLTTSGSGTANAVVGGNTSVSTLTLNIASGTTTYGGTLGGSGANENNLKLTKTGAGTLELRGANTYTGVTTINAGTLLVGANAPSGANGALGSASSAVLLGDITGSSSASLLTSGAFTIGRAVTVQSLNSGTITLGGNTDNNSTFSGAISLQKDVTVTQVATSGGNTLTLSGGISAGTSGTKTVTFNNAGAVTVSTTAIANGSGIVTLTKQNSGTLTLSGTNTYTGGTTINAGTVVINSASSLGNSSGSATINAATLQSSATFTSTRNFTLGDAASTISVDPSQTLTLSGVLSGSGSLTKSGTGALALSGNNSYSGNTTVSAGTLTLGGANTMGGSGKNVTLTAGTLNLNNAGALGSANNTFIISGGTIDNTSGGAITLSGNNAQQWNGDFTFTGSQNLSLGSGAVTLGSTRQVTVSAGTLTVSGVISGTDFGLTKAGTGKLTLSGASTYSGATAINQGAINMQHASALGSGGVTVADGAALEVQNNSTVAAKALALSGTGLSGAGALHNVSGANSWAGAITLNASSQINANNGSTLTLSGGLVTASGKNVTVGGAGTVTFASAISGAGSFTKDGSGTVILSAAGSYSGVTTISAGILEVGANAALGTADNGTTVSSDATLRLQSGLTYTTAEALSITGTGAGGIGALTTTGGSVTYAGTVTVAGNATINSGGGTLTLTGGVVKNGTTATFTGGGQFNITGAISGSSANSDLVVDDTTVVLNTANSYNGPTTVKNSGTLKLGASNVLPTSPQTALTLNTSGALDLASHSDSVASLTGDSSGVVKNTTASSTGTLTVNPASGSTTFAGTISGTAGGDVALVKSGAGTLVLSGASTYSGGTTLSAGTLKVANVSALGATASALNVNGGSLQLATDSINAHATTVGGNVSFVSDRATVGNGVTHTLGTLNIGAYQLGVSAALGGNINSDTAYGLTFGATTLSASGAIFDVAKNGSGIGTLTLASVTGAGNSFTVRGEGNTTVSGAITTTTGGITKGGGGTLTLSGNNAFTGGLNVSGGNVLLNNSGALNSGNNAVVMAGGTLSLNGLDQTITSLSGAAGTINNTAGTDARLTVNQSGNTTFGGTLTDGGSGKLALTKSGSGTLQLDAANTYTGGTRIEPGTLKLGVAGAVSTGGINFAGGILDANNITDSALGTLTLSVSSTLNFHRDSTPGTLTFSSMPSYTAGSVLTINGWAGTLRQSGSDDKLIIGGTLPSGFLANVSWPDLTGGPITGALQLGDGEIVPAPEPINVALGIFGAVFASVAAVRKLRARAQA